MRRDPTTTAATKLTGTVRAILDGKDGTIRSIGPADTVYAAVEKLKEWSVGALLVMQDSQLVGMFSERDYALKIILEGRASKSTRVDEIMTTPVISVTLSTPLPECMRLMTERRIRHLPVMEQDKVIGVISISDLVRAIIQQQGETIDQLNALITDPIRLKAGRTVNAYVYLLVYLLATIGIVGMVLGLNALLGHASHPAPPSSSHLNAVPRRSASQRARLSIKYYPIAIFFLLFDLETVLLFVWVGSFGPRELAMISLFSFLFFMAVLALVFVYLWKEGAFEWR
jgi:NADH:ubiquinone oxidoreductase subunit 3 (subunit A)/CBS domain-containing protein